MPRLGPLPGLGEGRPRGRGPAAVARRAAEARGRVRGAAAAAPRAALLAAPDAGECVRLVTRYLACKYCEIECNEYMVLFYRMDKSASLR